MARHMTKTVNITIDIAVARKMLTVAGFNYDEIYNASDGEIFEKVLSMVDIYGATYKTPNEDAKNYIFPYASALKQRLKKMKDKAESPEAFNDLLQKFFDEGNTITVKGEKYDYAACLELV